MSIASIFKPTNRKRILFFILFDVLISIATLFLAYLLRFNFSIPLEYFSGFLLMLLVLLPLKITLFFKFKIYFVAWRYFGLLEYKKIIVSHLITYVVFSTLFLIFYELFAPFPRSVILIDLFLSLFFIGFLRISRRIYLESS